MMICKQNSFSYSYGPIKIAASTEGLLTSLARDLNNSKHGQNYFGGKDTHTGDVEFL